MGRALFLAIALVACSSPVKTTEERQVVTSCTTLTASADTYLRRSQMHHSFGHAHHLRAGDHDESLVAFDLSSIPATAALVSATLSLYVVDNDTHSPVNVHRATAAWDENSTYASFAQHYDHTVLGGFQGTKDLSRVSVELQSLVAGWVAGTTPNHGILLETSSHHE